MIPAQTALVLLLANTGTLPALPPDGLDTLHLYLGGLVDELHRKTGERAVMIGAVEGAYAADVKRALSEALYRAGIKTAHTEAEMREQRERYRAQGVDVYKDKDFQRMLLASRGAKLTVTVENVCVEKIDDKGPSVDCKLWLRGSLPASLAFAAHRSFNVRLPKPPPPPEPEVPPSPYEGYGRFVLLLLAYAFLPPFLHRLDLLARRPDGSWRAFWLFPIYLIGNRLIVFVLVLSALVVGPFFFDRWVEPLEPGLKAAAENLAYAAGVMFVVHLVGCLFVALWRDSARAQGYAGTFRELFVLHPAFWTRELER